MVLIGRDSCPISCKDKTTISWLIDHIWIWSLVALFLMLYKILLFLYCIKWIDFYVFQKFMIFSMHNNKNVYTKTSKNVADKFEWIVFFALLRTKSFLNCNNSNENIHEDTNDIKGSSYESFENLDREFFLSLLFFSL